MTQLSPLESARRPHDGGLRIVDVVFQRSVSTPWRTTAFAVAAAIGLHLALWVAARNTEPSLESWSAELATRVHAELGRVDVIELAPPPPAPVPQTPPETPPMADVAPPPPRERLPRTTRATKTPPPPAQAGQVVAQEPSASDTVDLSGETFVTGTASAYAGGTTTARGTNSVAVTTRTVDPHATPTRAPGEPDRSNPVHLEADEWQCAWPREADEEQIDEQFVVLRVFVGESGRAVSANLVSDPGHGFGTAAVACAMRTRFTPARDSRGVPMATSSPPIRVRFTR